MLYLYFCVVGQKMNLKLVLFLTACLSYFLVPAASVNLLAAGAAKGVIVEGYGETYINKPLVIDTKPPSHVIVEQNPPPHVIVEHKPVTLVPLATIPTYGFMDRLAKLWSGISDSIGAKIKAAGEFFRAPPNVVLVNVGVTTRKPLLYSRGPAVEIIENRVPVPVPIPVMVEDCGYKCVYTDK